MMDKVVQEVIKRPVSYEKYHMDKCFLRIELFVIATFKWVMNSIKLNTAETDSETVQWWKDDTRTLKRVKKYVRQLKE